jgi:hypothetical protein
MPHSQSSHHPASIANPAVNAPPRQPNPEVGMNTDLNPLQAPGLQPEQACEQEEKEAGQDDHRQPSIMTSRYSARSSTQLSSSAAYANYLTMLRGLNVQDVAHWQVSDCIARALQHITAQDASLGGWVDILRRVCVMLPFCFSHLPCP